MGGYDERFVYGEDFDLWSRVSETHQFATIPEILVDYRVLSTSLTGTVGRTSGNGAAISRSNVARLLDRTGGRAPTPDEHAAYCALMLGLPLTLGSTVVAGAFARAVELLAAFCAHARVNPTDATKLRFDVIAFLRHRFIESIELFSAADFEHVGEVLYGKSRWLRLMRAGPVRSAIAVAARSPLVAALVRGLDRS